MPVAPGPSPLSGAGEILDSPVPQSQTLAPCLLDHSPKFAPVAHNSLRVGEYFKASGALAQCSAKVKSLRSSSPVSILVSYLPGFVFTEPSSFKTG